MAPRMNTNPVLLAMRDDDIAHDPWGTSMTWFFAVAERLFFNHDVLVTGFRPSPMQKAVDLDSEPDGMLAEMGLTINELIKAARLLDRYTDWVRAAGRDY